MYKIYCDGACSKNGQENAIGGYGYAIYKNSLSIKHGNGHIKNATNNIAELMAMIAACEYILPKLQVLDNVEIYTDSAYIANCFKDRWWEKWINNGWLTSSKKPVENKELWGKLIPFFNDSRFKIYKVKGHAGITENEFVDYLARSGVNNIIIDSEDK